MDHAYRPILSEDSFVVNAQTIRAHPDEPIRMMGLHHPMAAATDLVMGHLLDLQARSADARPLHYRALTLTLITSPEKTFTCDAKLNHDLKHGMTMWSSLTRMGVSKDVIERYLRDAVDISAATLAIDPATIHPSARFAVTAARGGYLEMKYTAKCEDLSNHQRMSLLTLEHAQDADRHQEGA